MVRAPCCEKMGVKKGPWTPEEDEILVSYIQRHGHGNWRAIPKQAGILRCGKSCRLRWTNYLRPGIKRGNFTKEEDETIIELHQLLGNRWSAIAGRLPGRTDNEIKNYWHTHLKKTIQDDIMGRCSAEAALRGTRSSQELQAIAESPASSSSSQSIQPFTATAATWAGDCTGLILKNYQVVTEPGALQVPLVDSSVFRQGTMDHSSSYNNVGFRYGLFTETEDDLTEALSCFR